MHNHQENELIAWLLHGDVAIQYQVYRDLLSTERKDLRERIATEGWGQHFLSRRHPNGHWGDRFYQPKWTSSHYTLLDLRNLYLPPENGPVRASIEMILETCQADDGGIRLGPSTSVHSDICVNGMFLNYASYFSTEEKKLHRIVDSLLTEVMPDGGFNCMSVRSGAKHSSLHSTLSVLEGLHEFQKTGTSYRKEDIDRVRKRAEEFILLHRLFLSDHTGRVIQKDFLKLTFPARWKFNILRALNYFQYSRHPWDERMKEAIAVLLKKRNKEGTWSLQAPHPGQVHFSMEETGKPSRWNTLQAMRVLNHFQIRYI